MPYKELFTLEDIDLKKRRVFLRADYDVPVSDEGKILDDFRIKESLPTIKKIFQKGASQIIIGAHLGRPENNEKKYSMDEVAKRLFKLSGRKVEKMRDCIDLDDYLPDSKECSIVLLENLRFHKEEEENNYEFAEKLAKLADVYVNDAFATCHREHASMHAITKFLPGGIGLKVEQELKIFDSINDPDRPFVAILGGAKLETKLPVIMNLINKADTILLGGAMIFTFYKARGLSVGKSIYSKEYVMNAKILGNNEKIILPTDVVVADSSLNPGHVLTVTPDKIPSYLAGLDVGEKSLLEFKQKILEAKLVVWNGPLGYYENKLFAKSTEELLKFLAEHGEIKTIIGGGDTAKIVNDLKLQNKFYHVSTGGGAGLILLEGKELIALEELKKNTEIFKKEGK